MWRKMKKARTADARRAFFGFLSWRRPTFPRRYQRSIIGPAGLNYRVRDGNGCDPRGITTRKFEKVDLRPLRVESRTLQLNKAGEPQILLRMNHRCVSFTEKRSFAPRCGTRDDHPSRMVTTVWESFMVKPNGRLVRVSFTHCCASTPRLSRS